MKAILHQALEINSTTIIPNFGAFMKMGKSVLFNEFLKYDDGKLSKFVANSKGISEEEAKTVIENWVSEINSLLEAGDKIELENLGVLIKENGKIKFTLSTQTLESKTEVKEESKIPAISPQKEKDKAEDTILPNTKDEPKEKEIKKVEVPKVTAKAVNISTDFSAQDAIDKIKSFDNKGDLIAFTREDKRKTVIDALNKKLDALNGKQVEQEEDKQEKDNAVVENEIVEVTKEESKELPESEEEKEVVVEPIAIPVEKIEEKPDPIRQPEEKNEIPKPETKDLPVIDHKDKVQIVEDVPIKEEKIEKKETKNDDKAIAAIVESVDKTEKQLKKRKRRRLVLWLSILCFLIGGGLLTYLKLDLIKSYFAKEHEPKELADNTEKNKKEEEIENDKNTIEPNEVEENVGTEEVTEIHEEVSTENTLEVVEEPVEVIEEEKPVEKQEKVNVPVTSGNYHVVAGSFSTEENAENKVKSLIDKGYTGAKILGKYNGLYTVGAMSFDSKSSASEALDKFKAEGNKGFVKKL